MKIILIITLLCLLISCTDEKAVREDRFEKEVLECTYAKYNSLGINLKQELKEFENYLIKKQILKDSTSKSYVSFYKEVIKNDSILKFPGEYEIDSILVENLKLYQTCYNKFDRDKSEEYKVSRFRKYMKLVSEASKEKRVSNFIKKLMIAVDSNSFDIMTYKLPTLLSFYLFENSAVDLRAYEKLPKIEVIIHANHDVFINNDKVDLDNFINIIQAEISKFSDTEKEIYIVRLGVDKETRMSIVSDVKELLREANSLRISYRTLETRVPYK